MQTETAAVTLGNMGERGDLGTLSHLSYPAGSKGWSQAVLEGEGRDRGRALKGSRGNWPWSVKSGPPGRLQERGAGTPWLGGVSLELPHPSLLAGSSGKECPV
jgi:hypothetical protein